MLESLEEAIIVIKGDSIEFKNHLLTSIIQRIKAFPMVMIPNDISDEEILQTKFIQVYRKNQDEAQI